MASGASPTATPRAMGFFDHLEELRRRFIVSFVAVMVATLLAFSIRIERASPWIRFSAQDNLAAQVFAIVRDDMLPAGVELVSVRPMDGFMAQMGLAFAIGLTLSMPIVLDQARRFVSPALKPREKRYLALAIAPVTLLFIVGAAFAYAYIVPFVLEALYGYTTALGAAPLLRIDDLVSYTVTLLVTFGIAFQTPLVMMSLSAVGLVQARTWWKGWRFAVIGALIVGAFVTDPSPTSQILVAVPLVGLYLVGAVLASTTQATSR